MMKFLFGIGLCLILGVNSMSAHDIHVSMAELELKENGELDISLRIFFDDLLLACGLTPGEELPSEYKSSDELIETYVSNHFKLYTGEKKLELEYVESFSDNMAVWIELKVVDFKIDLFDSIDVENTILLQEFDDQLNILNYSREQNKDSYTFNKKKPRIPIKIK